MSTVFLGKFSKFKQFDLSQFLNGLFGFLTESVGFSCLTQVGSDRLCSVFLSERIHQVSNLGYSSLIFKHCILWKSLNTEIHVEMASLRTRFPAA